MKILNLIKCEFIKNYTFLKVLLVLIVLMVSVVIVAESSVLESYISVVNPKKEIENLERIYESVLEEETMEKLEKEFELNRALKSIELYKELEKLGKVDSASWQSFLVSVISDLENELFVIKQMQENPNEEFTPIEITDETVSIYSYDEAIILIQKLSQVKPLEELEREYQKEIKAWKNILQENKFYQYIEYRLEQFEENGIEDSHFTDYYKNEYQITEENKKNYQYIVSKKIENEKDIRIYNFIQLQKERTKYDILSEEEWRKENESYSSKDYEGYVRYTEAENKIIEKETAIISYSFNHQKRHDLQLQFQQGLVGHGYYHNTKSAVNQVLNLPVVILSLVILTSSGIVSQEHSAKTDKALLTSPIKRYKVLGSKFLYLIIHTYLIWFVAFLLIFLYSGIRFGFTDLFTSKLIYQNGSVQEVNYIFYMIKMILMNGIPILAMISILFMISTITLNTATTAGISITISILSIWLWEFVNKFKLFFLVYTSFPYVNLFALQEGNDFALSTLYSVKISQGLGLLVSVITIVICYGISNVIYITRDIKN